MAKNPETKVKFSIFNKEFNDGIREMGRESSNLRKEFKLKEEQLKLNGSESDKLKNKIDYLAKEHEIAKNKVKATEEQLEKAKQVYGENSTEVQKLNNQLLNAQIAEQKFANELAIANKELAEKENKLKNVGKKLEETGDKMKSAGSKLTTGVTLPLAAAGGAAAKFAMDQEESFAKVSTLLDGSADDMDEYRKQMRKASSDMTVYFDEYSDSVYNSISAGIDQADAIEFTNKAVKLAKGGFTSTTNAVDIMTTALNSYKLEAEEATNISDMLVTTQNEGKTTVDELASSMGKVIPTAKAQGVEFAQLATGYAVLTKNGVATSEAGTRLNAMLGELGKSGSRTDKILREKTGKSFSELSAEGHNVSDVLAILQSHAEETDVKLSDLFGSTEAGAAALILSSESGQEFNEILGKMQDSAGATDAAFEKMQTSNNQMKEAMVAVQNATAEFGEIIAPVIIMIAGLVTWLAGLFAGMSDEMKLVVVIVGSVVAAIGPLIWIVGSLIKSIGIILPVLAKLGPAFTVIRTAILALTGPIGIIIAIVTLLAIVIYKNWDSIKAFILKAVQTITSFIKNNFPQIYDTIKKYLDMALAIVRSITEFWKNTFRNATDFLKALIRGDFQGMYNAIKSQMDNIKNTISSIWNSVMSFFKGISLTQIGKDIIQGLINGLTSMIGKIKDTVKNVANLIPSGVKSFLRIQSPSRVLIEKGEEAGEGLAIGLENKGDDVSSASNLLARYSIPDIDSYSKREQSSIQNGVMANLANQAIYLTLVSTLDGQEVARNQYSYIDGMLSEDYQLSEFLDGLR